MSTWDPSRYEQPMSQARLRAEMQWAALTSRAPDFLAGLGDVPSPRPAPAVPRGQGRRQRKPARPVLVEKRRTKLVSLPDGGRLACKRTQRTVIMSA